MIITRQVIAGFGDARAPSQQAGERSRGYNFNMRFWVVVCSLFVLCGGLVAKDKTAKASAPDPVTVPATIDHNRVVIDVDIPLPDGSVRRIHAWVDNGDPDLNLSRHLATLLGLNVSCDDKECSSPPPREIRIDGMTIPLADVKKAEIPLKPVSAASVLANGMNVEINIPSTVLRHYDVLIDFPEHKFTIGQPGSIHFLGVSSKVQVTENGLIEVPSQIENKKYNLALDIGSNISFISQEIFDQLADKHPDWPHMTGAVGSANMWGADEEARWKVMRLDRLQYGPLFLTNVAVVALPKTILDFFEKRAGVATIGLLSSEAVLNYRVGLDYAHSTVYFDLGRFSSFPDFDVVGLVLRPEDDGRYTILEVADFEGKRSVAQGPDGVQAGDVLAAVGGIPVRGSTMGQVWSMLGGTPGQERKLTIEGGGKQFTVSAQVQHFLGETRNDEDRKKKR